MESEVVFLNIGVAEEVFVKRSVAEVIFMVSI
jgi:hypothetical protein